MAVKQKRLYAGLVPTTETTAYTVPASTEAIVTSVAITNLTATEATCSLKIAGLIVLSTLRILPNDTTVIDLKEPMTTGENIAISAGTANAINARISGVEVS